jgi:hypothetical protein
MDESEAVEEQAAAATPIFGVYRRGYDPEQVDRYVADHQRRLDDALHRASESERKLAAAVGQLRELHRRVAVYESEARNAQPPQLDTLGERVQRILQEAWEGAYTLRQEAEREVNELRDRTAVDVEAMRSQARADVDELRDVASKEAAEVVDEATRRALHIRDETERRRQAYLERVERDREQAIAQITYLYDQRQGAIAELARLQASVQATVEEMVRSPLGRPAPGVMEAAVDGAKAARLAASRAHPTTPAGGPAPDAGPSSGATAAVTAPESAAETQASELPVEAPHLPGVVPESAAGADDPQEGSDVTTGPMERFVRPTDRDAARAAVRPGPDAEADAMERVMHARPQGAPDEGEIGTADGPRPAGAPTGRASRRPSAAKLAAAAETVQTVQTVQTVPGTEAEAADAGASAAGPQAASRPGLGPMLGGLIRPRRQAPPQGVYDAEQDG